MTAHRPSQNVHPDSRGAEKRPTAMMRTDLESMMLPLFAEDTQFKEFSTTIKGQRIRIHSESDDKSIAGVTDKKLLNLLTGYVASMIRSGGPVTRHISVEVSSLMHDMFGSSVHGGADYARLAERLDRLKFTVIEILSDLPNGHTRKRLFSWLDVVQYDRDGDETGRKIHAIKISFSEDAFEWITRAAGIDMPPSAYQSVGSGRTSSWRIYEICLARLISSGRDYTSISLSELRDRIPITSELKVFKARTLKLAMSSIEESAEMSGHIKLQLARRKGGQFEAVSFSDRGALSELVVVISKGDQPLPKSTPLLTKSAFLEEQKM